MRSFRFGRLALLAVLPASLVCLSAADPPPGPKPKGRIERPVKDVVANTIPAPAPVVAADNPTVEAGKVKWHKTLEDAQAASIKSGKPVLLFQMMGYLDKKFC